MLDAFAVGGEGLAAVEAVNRAIQRLMRFAQIGRHGERVIQISECRALMCCTRIEDGLRQRTDFILRGIIGFGSWEIIVNDADGIAVIAFQSTTDITHPCHVRARC